MEKLNGNAYLVLIARLVLSASFLFAALPKIQDPVAFATSVEGFQVVNASWSSWVALVLPWLELVVGFGLLIPQIRRSSEIIIGGLLLLFIGLHASAWMRGLDISCGCFGATAHEALPNYLWLIARNCALLAISIVVLIRDCRNPRQKQMTEAMRSS